MLSLNRQKQKLSGSPTMYRADPANDVDIVRATDAVSMDTCSNDLNGNTIDGHGSTNTDANLVPNPPDHKARSNTRSNHRRGSGDVRGSGDARGSGDVRQQDRIMAIEETIVEKGSVRFSDVAGLNEAKQTLREAVIVPLQFPHLFTGGLEPWRRILLYGPPGTGKSYLAKAVSSEINSTFYCVSSADIMSSWVGESEKLIKDLFHHAKNRVGKSVIFIDEVDSMCRRRSIREEEYTRRIKTELLKQMEGVSSGHDDLFLMCATNCPWELDPAFLRRFQKRIYIPLPDKDARVGIMKKHAVSCAFSDEDWSRLCDQMDGYSGSDIATVTLGALFQPVRDLQVAKSWIYNEGSEDYTPCSPSVPGHIRATMFELPAPQVKPRLVNIGDFNKSLFAHSRTVTKSDLEKFETFTREFGIAG